MRLVKVVSLSLLLASPACAPSQPNVAKAPAPVPDTFEATESVAVIAERHINAAEKDLDSLRPDLAEEKLKEAERALSDSRIDAHPEAKILRGRHDELEARIPVVREEVRKRELAAAVAAAKEKIEAAQAEMKASLAEIKKNAPDDAELKHAEESVTAVRSALDANEALESKDIEYAKYALGVRKTLPDQKKLVEQRRLDVAVAASKEEVGRATATLADALGRLKNRDVADADFDEARKAAGEVEKALEKGAPLVGRDVRYATFAATTKQKVTQQKAGIDQRQIEVAVGRQRTRIEDGRKTLADALTAIKRPDVVEAGFNEAEAAVKAIDDLLKEGEHLKAKDRGYASYALQIGLRLKEATARITARQLEVSVQASKKEISGRSKIVDQTLRRLSAKAPADGEFEDARNAAGELEKALDAASPLAAKDAAFKKYVTEQQASLKATRKEIDARKLAVEIDQQHARVAEALSSLAHSTRRMATTDAVEQASAAAQELGKVIDAGEGYAPKNAAYAKYASEARKTKTTAEKQISDRRDELEMEAQQAKVKAAEETVAGALSGLNVPSPVEDQFKNASDATAAVKKILEDGAPIEKKLGKYRTFADAARKKVALADERIEKRKLEVAVREQKTQMQEALATAKSVLSDAKKADATSDIIKAANTALDLAKDQLTKGASLEKRDAPYATYATATRTLLDQLKGDLAEAKAAVAFREGPIAALSNGQELAASAGHLGTPEERQKAYKSALEQFGACRKDGASILADSPKIASAQFVMGRKKAKGANLLTLCAEATKSAEAKLEAVNATLAFYEGPGRSFGKATNALEAAKAADGPDAKRKAYGEALTHFETCLETGRILQHRHPELSKAQFELDGRKITLPAVVTACQKEAKTLRVSNAKN